MFKKAVIVGMICLSLGSVALGKSRELHPGSVSLASTATK